MARFPTRALISTLAIFSLFLSSSALFEDQAGKDDWTLQHVGKVKFAHFDSRPNKNLLYVVSEQGALAAMSSTSTQDTIAWRRMLPEGSEVLKFERSAKDLAVLTSSELLVFDLEGLLSFQVPFPSSSIVNMAYTHGIIYVSIVSGKTLRQYSSADWRTPKEHTLTGVDEVFQVSAHSSTIFYLSSQQSDIVIKSTSGKDAIKTTLTKKALETSNLAFTASHLVVANSKLHFISLTSADKKVTFHMPSNSPEVALNFLVGSLVTVNGKVFGPSGEIASSIASSAFCPSSNRCFFSAVDNSKLSVYKFDGESAPTRQFQTALGDSLSSLPAIFVPEVPKGSTESKALYILQRADWSLECGKASKKATVIWTREEAMAVITASIIVDVPAKIHEGLLVEDGGHLWHRLNVHYEQLKELISIPSLYSSQMEQLVNGIRSGDISMVLGAFRRESKHDELSKDQFGFSKFLIGTTKSNSVVCYHSLTRQLLWSTQMPSDSNLDLLVEKIVLTQKSSPQGPILTIFGKNAISGLPFSIQVSALTGKLFNFKTYAFNFATILTPKTEEDAAIRPILFVDEEAGLFVDPTATSVHLSPKTFHYYLANEETGAIAGYTIANELSIHVSPSAPSESLVPSEVHLTKIPSQKTWEVQLGSPIDILVHNQVNTISPAKVVGVDRDILPKYLNPNAIAVGTTQIVQQTTQSVDADKQSKSTNLIVSIIDTVTGHVIHRTSHRGASGRPYADSEGSIVQDKKRSHPMWMKLIFRDDWFVFTYWSSRFNRFELTSVEMFEKEPNFVTSDDKKSSFTKQPEMDVRSQSFILVGSVRVLSVTQTHLGISVQDLLVVYQDGKTSQITIKFLDPRRPMKQEDDPSLRQYHPYIPYDGSTIINYHNVISGIHTVHCAPTALESSSVVWLVGTDSFVRLISQHGESFDRLAHDYSFLQIGTICIGLGVLTYIFYWMSQVKAHRERWN